MEIEGTHHSGKPLQDGLIYTHTVIGLLKVHTCVLCKLLFRPLQVNRHDPRHHGDEKDGPEYDHDVVNTAWIVSEAKAHACLKPRPSLFY
jgi:hypothetical protein